MAAKEKVITKSRREQLREQSALHAYEKVDPTPMEVPQTGYRPITLRDEMRRFVQQAVSDQASQHGFETFEEADDFEDDEADQEEAALLSAYTVVDTIPEPGQSRDDLEGEPNAEDREIAAQEASQEPQVAVESPLPNEGITLSDAEMSQLITLLQKVKLPEGQS